MSDTEDDLARATQALADLRAQTRSVLLATVDAQGAPEASYAPFALDGAGRFIVFVSRLSAHTRNLLEDGRAAALLIEDEARSPQIYARRRVAYRCRVERLERSAAGADALLDLLAARHGEVLELLRGLGDFELLALTPESGQLVLGFGRAYRLTGEALSVPEHIGPPG
jgi:putative heme iron utilization protein